MKTDEKKLNELKESREIQAKAKECQHLDNHYMPWDSRFWLYKITQFGIKIGV